MPKTVLPVVAVGLAGSFQAEAAADVANGNAFVNDGRTFVLARNADGAAPHNVTFVTPGKVGGIDISDPVVAVPASATRLIGPFPPNLFNQKAGGVDAGKCYVTGADANIKLTVYRLP